MSSYVAVLAAAWFVNICIWLFLYGQRREDPVKTAFLLFVTGITVWQGVEILIYFPLASGKESLLFRLSSVFWISSGWVFLNFVYVLLNKKRDRDAVYIVFGALTLLAVVVSVSTDLWIEGALNSPFGVVPLPGKGHFGISMITAASALTGLLLLIRESARTRDRARGRTLLKLWANGVFALVLLLILKVIVPKLTGWTDGYRFGDSTLALYCLMSYWAASGHSYRAVCVERAARDLFGDAIYGVVIVDFLDNIRLVNSAAIRLLRLTDPVKSGTPLGDIIPVPLPRGEAPGIEFSVETSTKQATLLAEASPLVSNGVQYGSIVLLRDITKQKKKENRLRRRQSEMEKEMQSHEKALHQVQKIEALSALSAGIAHDFNNLLGVILGFAGAAREEISKDSPVADDINEIILASRRGKNIVDQILAFSKTGKRDLRVIAVGDVIEDVLSSCKSHMTTAFQVVEDVKNPHLAVRLDPSQMKQALLDLVLNAYQAMDKSGGTIFVSRDGVSVDEGFAKEHADLVPGEYVKIEVRDTGSGIPAHAIGCIFDPRYTTRKTANGAGLGLPTAMHVVNGYGGTLIVESEVGVGTKVSVYLPRFELPAASIAPRPSVERVGHERILIVDDEEQFVRVGRRILEPLGYDVTVHTDSISAWNAFWSNPDAFDLVITDHSMPRVDGSELANEIAYIRPDLPIILVSGDAQAQKIASEEDIVFTEFLAKPIPSDILGDTVRRLLDAKDE